MKKYVCLDIGGTAIKYGLIDDNGCIIEKSNTPTEAEKILDTAVGIVEHYKNTDERSGI